MLTAEPLPDWSRCWAGFAFTVLVARMQLISVQTGELANCFLTQNLAGCASYIILNTI
jgi:hypothetical protein